MIDFIDNLYTVDYTKLDGYDMERARQKAIEAVMPFIIDNELTPKQSTCLKYKYFSHKNQTEIAELLKLSQPTVSRYISKAKDKVNNSLQYCYIALTKGMEEYDRLSNTIN